MAMLFSSLSKKKQKKNKQKKTPAKRMEMKLTSLLFHEIYDAKNAI